METPEFHYIVSFITSRHSTQCNSLGCVATYNLVSLCNENKHPDVHKWTVNGNDWSVSRWGIIISNLIDLEKKDWSPKFIFIVWNISIQQSEMGICDLRYNCNYSITVYKLNIFNITNTLATSVICKLNQDLGQTRAYLCLCVRVSEWVRETNIDWPHGHGSHARRTRLAGVVTSSQTPTVTLTTWFRSGVGGDSGLLSLSKV